MMVGNVRWIVLADSKRAHAFESTGVGKGLRKLDEMIWNADKTAIHSDQPGRSFSSGGTARSAMEPHINRTSEEALFAKTIIDDLHVKHLAEKFDALVLVAGPQMLSALVNRLQDRFDDIEVRTLQKNLLNTPVQELPNHLQEIMVP